MRPARNRAVRAARQFNPCRERFCVCMSWHTFYFSQPENAGTWYADWLVSLSEEVVPRRQMSLSNIAGLRVFLLSSFTPLFVFPLAAVARAAGPSVQRFSGRSGFAPARYVVDGLCATVRLAGRRPPKTASGGPLSRAWRPSRLAGFLVSASGGTFPRAFRFPRLPAASLLPP